MANRTPSQTINLTIRSREGAIINKQDVFAVTSVNQKGIFDILPEHENFISIIKDRIVVHKNRKENQEIKIGIGILKVANNVVNIFLGMHAD